jgi:hypothetical protein
MLRARDGFRRPRCCSAINHGTAGEEADYVPELVGQPDQRVKVGDLVRMNIELDLPVQHIHQRLGLERRLGEFSQILGEESGAALSSRAPVILLLLPILCGLVRLAYIPDVVHPDDAEHPIRVLPEGMLHMPPMARDALTRHISAWMEVEGWFDKPGRGGVGGGGAELRDVCLTTDTNA